MIDPDEVPSKIILAIHGGAGTIPRETMTPGREARFRAGLEQALRAGFEAMQGGAGASLDGVEAAIRSLEDCPLFNAGRGSAFHREGGHELDAALMEGRDRRVGAVAGLTRIRNPVAAARAVMERSGHVLMAGTGAEAFAEACGLEAVDPSYFDTDERREALREYLKAHEAEVGALPRGKGTVGAVAVDRRGDLAAGASTGGTTGKRRGRVGDTPVPGAGIYAENGICAVSCTGDGEFFLRLAVAHEIVALVKHGGLHAREAAERVIRGALKDAGGEGGAIVLDPEGHWAMPFHSGGMYRGLIDADGTTRVAIFEDWLAQG